MRFFPVLAFQFTCGIQHYPRLPYCLDDMWINLCLLELLEIPEHILWMFSFCPQDFEVQFVLDAKKPKSPRMFLLSELGRNIMNYTLRLEKDTRFCRSFTVYIKVCNVHNE
jgi:hypothetical protein